MNADELRSKRDALVSERDAVIARIRYIDDSAAEYVERDKLDALNLDISIYNDEILRSEAEAPTEGEARAHPDNERLTELLRRQDEARVEREEMVRAREMIQRLADEDGRADLDVDEDRRFRDLTRGIAELDGEVVARDEEIDKLAALAAIDTEA